VPARLPIVETDPCRPASPYAASKLAAEVLAAASTERGRFSVVALRVAGVQQPETWHEPLWERERSPILWTWISARDASRAFRAAIDAPVVGAVVINVAAADTCSLRPSGDLAAEFLPGAQVDDQVMAGADPRWPLFDLERAQTVLDWEALDRFDALFAAAPPDSFRPEPDRNK
jgi:nucleoside-diphosphate-sugar epimerase